ncbi:MAG: NADH-quinone oxidoreductase subunit NuoB, partial [Actinomycetota bacterium]|nr:NADH-quinone oxidoreductase subunit NuoB [Actinomycetota bacterium]
MTLPGEPVRLVVDVGRRYRLAVFDLGLACCAVEFVAATLSPRAGTGLRSVPLAQGPREADVLVVSGTVTDALAPAVLAVYAQMVEPRYVVSMGSCANSGGPYWDSYCVAKGVDQVLPVDVYVPGCPPRPEALLAGLLQLQAQIAGAATVPDAAP